MHRILFILFLVPNLFSHANGGPYSLSHFRKTGNIRLLQEAHITLERENLNIKVVGDSTHIQVEYTLLNHGEQTKVNYGFPLDAWYQKGNMDFSDGEKEIYSPICGTFNASIDDEILRTSWHLEDKAYALNPDSSLDPWYQQWVSREWRTMKFSMEKGERKILRIKCTVKNEYYDHNSGFSLIPRFSQRAFRYDLSPAGKWGDGKVGELHIRLDLSSLESENVDWSLVGLDGWSRENAVLTLHTKAFQLHDSADIRLKYNRNHSNLLKYLERNEDVSNVIRKKFRVRLGNQRSVEALLDNDPGTSVEVKVGDVITLEALDTSIANKYSNQRFWESFFSLRLLNGDHSNAEALGANGHVAKVKLVVNDTIRIRGNSTSKRYVLMDVPIYRGTSPEDRLAESQDLESAMVFFQSIHDGPGLRKVEITISGLCEGCESARISELQFFLRGSKPKESKEGE